MRKNEEEVYNIQFNTTMTNDEENILNNIQHKETKN